MGKKKKQRKKSASRRKRKNSRSKHSKKVTESEEGIYAEEKSVVVEEDKKTECSYLEAYAEASRRMEEVFRSPPMFKGERGDCAFHLACANGNVDTVKVFLTHRNCNISQILETRSLLDNATPLHRSIENGSLEVVKLLIEHGANVNAVNIRGETSLHLAFKHRQYEIATYLLTKSANPCVHENRSCQKCRLWLKIHARRQERIRLAEKRRLQESETKPEIKAKQFAAVLSEEFGDVSLEDLLATMKEKEGSR